MTDTHLDNAAAKRERIKAISRTVHSIPVEEGGQLRPQRPAPLQPAMQGERFWKRTALAAGGVAGVALGFAAGLLATRRR
ncbi:hypothetical protein [Sphingomonas sp. LHG3406-1]|uniref:hypothetical protein n=1 Tax=Sphingomonas sp. LHG3406-1 TaxID=2804617 RepID=UPI00260FD7A9|nr:hypothetical protein [Sphingomonas sp. LHG3406-1]